MIIEENDIIKLNLPWRYMTYIYAFFMIAVVTNK